jgi:hypothetical protein
MVRIHFCPLAYILSHDKYWLKPTSNPRGRLFYFINILL